MAPAARTRLAGPRRRSRLLMVVMLVALINLPLVSSTWQRWRVDTAGVETTAAVVRTERLSGGYWLTFRYSEEVAEESGQDEDEFVGDFPAEVDRATWERAQESGEIGVRYLPSRPSAYEVDGQQRHWAGVITTLIADGVLLAILLLVWRYGGRRPAPLRVSAIGDLGPADLEGGEGDGLLEQVDGDLYLVRGQVDLVDGEEVWLDLGDRDVIVILDGHANPVEPGEVAQLRGRLLP